MLNKMITSEIDMQNDITKENAHIIDVPRMSIKILGRRVYL